MFHVQNESGLVLNKCLDVLVAHTTSKQPGDLRKSDVVNEKRHTLSSEKSLYANMCL